MISPKKPRCQWTEPRKLALLQLVQVHEPYRQEHGHIIETWKTIADQLSCLGEFKSALGVDWQACKRQFDKLLDAHRRMANSVQRRSGDAEEYTRIDEVLDDIAASGTLCRCFKFEMPVTSSEGSDSPAIPYDACTLAVRDCEEAKQKRRAGANTTRKLNAQIDSQIIDVAMTTTGPAGSEGTPPVTEFQRSN